MRRVDDELTIGDCVAYNFTHMRFVTGVILIFAIGSFLIAQQTVAPAGSANSPSIQTNSQRAQSDGGANNAAASGDSSSKSQAAQAVGPAAQSNPQQQPSDQTTGLSSGVAILPTVSKSDAAEAKRQFQSGVKLKKRGELDEAFTKFASASELDPNNYDYVAAREFTRQQLAMRALQRGNKAMLDRNEIVAMAEFQRALQYDPTNEYALQRMRDSMPEDALPVQPMSVVEESAPIELRPLVQHHDFHFRGDSRTLLTEVARGYGITPEFDDSVKQQRVHFDIQDVNFATAIQAAESVTKTFSIPLSPGQVLFLADTAENRRQFERMGLQTFYLPELNDQQLAEMTNSLRVLLNLRFISQDRAQSTLTIRAELPALRAAEQLIKSLTTGRPEVLLDMSVYAVNSSFARSLGTALPTQFNLLHIDQALLASLLGQNGQNLINQLIASGGINQANSQAIAALLAQLQNSSTSSIPQPLTIFGGGATLFAVTAQNPIFQGHFSVNDSDIRSLEHVTLRASHNDPAVMKIGERYPIINATYAPIYNSPAIAQVLGNQSYTAPFPSFNFEDLGINLRATPWIHGNSDVTMKLELNIRALTGSNNNGIPIIANREYTGTITVKDGESSVVTGLIDRNDTRAINGGLLSQVPGLGSVASIHDKNVLQDELLVVITPHILRLPQQTSFAVQLPSGH